MQKKFNIYLKIISYLFFFILLKIIFKYFKFPFFKFKYNNFFLLFYKKILLYLYDFQIILQIYYIFLKKFEKNNLKIIYKKKNIEKIRFSKLLEKFLFK